MRGPWRYTQGGPDGLLIVDDQFEALAPKINKALDTLSKAKIAYVLNTHWHFDHAGGNAVLGREGHIVAHRAVRTRLVTGGDMDIFGVMPPAKKEALPVHFFVGSFPFIDMKRGGTEQGAKKANAGTP